MDWMKYGFEQLSALAELSGMRPLRPRVCKGGAILTFRFSHCVVQSGLHSEPKHTNVVEQNYNNILNEIK